MERVEATDITQGRAPDSPALRMVRKVSRVREHYDSTPETKVGLERHAFRDQRDSSHEELQGSPIGARCVFPFLLLTMGLIYRLRE